ncbi:cystatin-A5 [Caretta caretta]|uniref:cystatin-A5 n=1 Tax=Caretta caretta TaxID=8467 RepID=UPI003F4B9934
MPCTQRRLRTQEQQNPAKRSSLSKFSSMSSENTGEWSEALRATPQIQEITNKVKPQLEEKVHKEYPVFVAVICRQLTLCGGTHYLIKVSISDSTDECVHLYVVQTLIRDPLEPELIKYQLKKKIADPLEPF